MSRDDLSQELWKGAVAGLVGGVVGAWAMNQFQRAWANLSKDNNSEQSGGQKQPESDEDATMRTANRLLSPVLGRELTDHEKKVGGPIVHYSFGGGMGALYGTLSELSPAVRVGAGAGFGSALFVGADEIAVPATGLSGSPTETPLKTHVYAWTSHIVYGLATEMARRGVRALLGNDSASRKLEVSRQTRGRKNQQTRSRRHERRAA